MKLDFIVTGMPRSGTAWMANFLTTGRVGCSHEGRMFGFPSRDRHDQIGDSCPSYLVDDMMVRDGIKVVVIERKKPIPLWAQKLTGRDEDWWRARLKGFLDRHEALVVQMEHMFYVNDLLRIWEFLSILEPFDQDRAVMLSRLHMEERYSFTMRC